MLRILAGVLLLVSGVATLLYGMYVSLKTGRQEYELGLVCGVVGPSLFALGYWLLDPDFRAELRDSRRNR